jgi:putative CocE/NonD family hydrolase
MVGVMPTAVVDLDVPATMRDGTVLRANVYRPAGDGPWPVLLTRLPYGKDLPLATGVIDPIQATRRGYMIVVQDTRGRFASEGDDWEPFRCEAEDGYDTVAWAAGLPGADGQVGMYGASYFGNTQWMAAIERPPALKALVPHVTWSDPLDGVIGRDGVFELGTAANWTLLQGLNQLMRRHSGDRATMGRAIAALMADYDRLATEGYWKLPLRGFEPVVRHRIAELAAFEAMTEPALADHFRVAGKHARVGVPTFNTGGWYDIFLAGTIENYQTMRDLGVPSKLLIGPWAHSASANPIGERNFGFGASAGFMDLRIDFMSLQLRWFDHWLKGIDTGMLEEPPVRIFVMGVDRWRDEPAWPLARSVETAWYLREGGRLNRDAPGTSEPASSFVYDPADPVPTRGGATLMSPEYRPGPYDQRPVEERADVLVFTSEPLERDLEVTGPVTVRLWAASSAPSTDWVARLCDVFPDGRSLNLTDGILRTRGEAGTAAQHVIDLWATSNVFRAGHRIRVHVTSSSFPRWDRNLNTGEPFGEGTRMETAVQTIFHDASRASRIVLPAVQ